MIDCSIADDSVCILRGYTPTFQTSEGYRAKLTYYLSLSQEIAALHAKLHNVDVPNLLKSNRSWVILYSNIEIDCYINWPEEWECRTFIVPERNPALSRRIVECYDSKGDRVFGTDSLWSVVKIDSDGHKSLSEATDVFSKFGYYKNSGAYSPFTRLKHFKIDEPTYKRVMRTSILDRDINDHATNISYLSWALDSIPASRIDEHKIRSVQINWSAEVYIGEEIELRIQENEDDKTRIFNADIAQRAYIKIVQEK